MAEPEKPTPGLIASVWRARVVALSHPSVRSAEEPVAVGSGMQLEILIEVPMPNAWAAGGISPSGVRRFEPVRLDFPARYPIDPPEVSLRSDFLRDIAHIQPWLTPDGRPVPCIQDGKMAEFMQHEGIAGILNQTVQWLDNAAEGNLIDPAQGWEPTRRDDVIDMIVADAAALRSTVTRDGGFRFSRLEYLRREKLWLYGQVSTDRFALNKASIKDAVKDHAGGGEYRSGRSLALVVWPGKQPSGKPVICETYAPDTVKNLRELEAKASTFGCLKELKDGLSRLVHCAKDYDPAGPFPAAVILCARRPFNLIGSDSTIELCFYTLDFYAANALPEGDETPVRPASHRDKITPALLATLSGLPAVSDPTPWTLIGAGSLGSKIALQMGRAGRGPAAVVDPAMMAPHNAARHAMIPYTGDMQTLSLDTKARQLSQALAGLSQDCAAITEDIAKVLTKPGLAKQAWRKKTWAVVNTTASLRVRAALCSSALTQRVIEALLYAEGKLGLIATEGRGRNPNIADLIAEFYALGRDNKHIAPLLYPEKSAHQVVRVTVGEGCGSPTMQISDGKISMYAAGASEYLLSRQEGGLPNGGELVIGRLQDTGMGIMWERIQVAPTTIVVSENGMPWTIRINPRAADKIAREVVRCPMTETGGVLMGRQDEAAQSFYIVDVLPAPEDSVRTPTEFILGTRGLKKSLQDYLTSTNVALYCLGTWHSHLAPSGPSTIDKQTAQAMGLARLAPSLLLIHTPDGYRAVLADQTSGAGARHEPD